MSTPKTPYDADVARGGRRVDIWIGAQTGYLRRIEDEGPFREAVRALVAEVANIMQVVDGDDDPDMECQWCGQVISDGHAVANEFTFLHSCPVPFLREALATVEALLAPQEAK